MRFIRLVLQQLIERAVPLLELACLDFHAWRPTQLARALVAPGGKPAPTVAVAHEVGLQPACQPVLAARRSEPIGDQHHRAIARRRSVVPSGAHQPIERRLQPELAPQLACRQHRSPVPGGERTHVLAPKAAIGGDGGDAPPADPGARD